MTNVATLHLEELKKELDEYKELSANRLMEIEKLNKEKAQCINESEKLKMDVSSFKVIYPHPLLICYHF